MKTMKKIMFSLALILAGLYNPQIQISAESGTKRSIFRQKKQNEAFKFQAAHTPYKAGTKG